jgi:hypothetical protein
MIFLNEKK